MNQKKLLAASVAAACLAMTTSALAADYSNHTETADGTTLAGHLTCKSSKDHSKPRNEVDTSLKSPV
ncbi:hypothetical protein [Sutterella wadsworthensis]|uniref:hypothetical protein n=1 Tax=Sutterella wadsworthensis TaxID=40545 RepID=UPI003AB98A05